MRVDQYTHFIELLQKQASSKNIYFVARFQNRKDLSVHINNGKTEEINSSVLVGVGIQVINEYGLMGFAASDQLSDDIIIDLFKKATFLAKISQAYNGETNQEIFKLTPLNEKIIINQKYPCDSLSLDFIETKLTELNQEIAKRDDRLSVRSMLRITDEEWRIVRSDGTDVAFNTPRSYIFHSITAKCPEDTATTYANLTGIDLEIIMNSENLQKLRDRAFKASNLALSLLNVGKIKGGNYKLIIDYALAKGLAHEAFGHAAETDALESSILGENGKMKIGLSVASPELSIIDGPLEGDYAYQPISALGIKRKTVKIVEDGRLIGGLSDVFSADRAGVPLTGAERVENFFHLPIARMSNIRIEFKKPLQINRKFEDITPEELYQILINNNLISADEDVLYLSGFSGGQVNPSFGDFVFHCSGIYALSENPLLYKPAIFSGKVLSVLHSVIAAIGPLQIDAMGTCGKMGQGVPSCGGSHYFLLIDKNPEIMIGGE